jgi:hypothetical protein
MPVVSPVAVWVKLIMVGLVVVITATGLSWAMCLFVRQHPAFGGVAFLVTLLGPLLVAWISGRLTHQISGGGASHAVVALRAAAVSAVVLAVSIYMSWFVLLNMLGS